MRLTKTFIGQTAGELLQTAKIAETRAGLFEIFVTDSRGKSRVVMLCNRPGFDGCGIRDAVAVRDVGGLLAILETDSDSFDRITELEAECEARYPALFS